jgi:hypothetical protein
VVARVAEDDDGEDLLQDVEQHAGYVFRNFHGAGVAVVVVAEVGAGVGPRVVAAGARGRTHGPSRGGLDRVGRRGSVRFRRHENERLQVAKDLTQQVHVVLAVHLLQKRFLAGLKKRLNVILTFHLLIKQWVETNQSNFGINNTDIRVSRLMVLR